ncbi:DMT family transporter [Bacteriovorax sp. DB6_IX]|uniref:DMT family transporter n=1 Tax=Bacteriovorax sp. DB6_IX TaxID=1353530 RepID=UPI00038A1845|nr:DMT family transporter [Bacteriovorax sp. DB6_IX]EQC52210.1 EamA-like transporter family protein [Bacteriovorax sp. DB6_IX]
MINYILFCTLALFWGGSFVAIKYLIHDVPAFTAALYRVFFAVIFMLIIFNRKLKLPVGWFGREFFVSCGTGLISIGIPFSLLFWGEKYVTPSMAGVLNGTVPLWTSVISILFFSGLKDMTLHKFLGLIMGFCGIALIFGPKIVFSGNIEEVYGLIAICIMAVFYGLGNNLNARLLSQNKVIKGNINIVIQQISSVLYLIIAVLIFNGVPDFSLLLKPQNYSSVLYLSLFSTCFAFLIFYHLIHHFGAVKASTVTFFVPPVALILDMIIFNRVLTKFEAIGAGVIFVSMYLLKNRVKNLQRV